MFRALKSALQPLKGPLAALAHPHSVGMLTQAELAAGGMGSRLSHMAGQGALYGGLGLLATDLGSPVFRGISNVAQDAAYGLGMNIDTVDTSARAFTKIGRQNYIAQQSQLRKAAARQKKYELLQRRMGQSMARLAAVDPQLYQHVVTGRQLPQGAVVLGGAPRVDLMEELALRMATSPQAIPGAPAQPSVMDLI
jgi:hypothetical protein